MKHFQHKIRHNGGFITYYYCEFCDYSTSRKCSFEKHCKSRKHLVRKSCNENKEMSSSSPTRRKHHDNDKKIIKENESTTKIESKNSKPVSNMFHCPNCKKEFKSRTSCWRHKKNCKESPSHHKVDVSHFVSKCFTCNFCGENFKSRTTCWRHKKKCKEETKIESKTTLHVTNNNVTNNIGTQNLSINLFLNNHCANAMNLEDFVDKLTISLEDLGKTRKLGYVDGMSNVLIENLKNMPNEKRPIHCCDSKRGKFFIKDEDKWEKETSEKIEKVIDTCQYKHIKKMKDWENAHPNYLKDEKLLKEWNDLIHCIMGDVVGERENENKKIIKNVGENVMIKDAMKEIENL